MTRPPKKTLIVAPVTIKSNGNYTNQKRTALFEKVMTEIQNCPNADVVIFPAGFYKTKGKPNTVYSWIEEKVKAILQAKSKSTTVCLGIDGRNGKDQVAIAVNYKGIIASGRKFYPTKREKDFIEKAPSIVALEGNLSRTFEVKGRKVFLAVCYDVYGITQKKPLNPGVDIVFALVHRFTPRGEGSGHQYFAKNGFAGVSKQWGCPVFGTAVFFNRTIPPLWPTGVIWNQGNRSTKNWKYTDNPISPFSEFQVVDEQESALVKLYRS